MANIDQLWDTNIGKYVKSKVEEINSDTLCKLFDELQPQVYDKKASLRVSQAMLDFFQERGKEKNSSCSTQMRVALVSYMKAWQIKHKKNR